MIEFIEKLNEKISKRKKYFTILNEVIFPKRSLILDVHDFLIFEFARTDLEIQKGTRDVATLDYVLFVIKNKVSNERSKNANVLICAAYLMNYLLCGHCFTDGNKRTAYVMSLLFLSSNGFILKSELLDYKKNYDSILIFAQKKVTDENNMRNIKKWLRKLIK